MGDRDLKEKRSDDREGAERVGFKLVSRYFDVSVKVSSENREPS